MAGEDQDEKMLQGSELGGVVEGAQWGSQCEGILGTSEAHCFPLHRRKQAREGKGLSWDHKDAGSPSSQSTSHAVPHWLQRCPWAACLYHPGVTPSEGEWPPGGAEQWCPLFGSV